MKQATPEQLECLRAYAKAHGRSWKAALNDEWRKGTDWKFPNGHLLRQVRNHLGPSWLAKLPANF